MNDKIKEILEQLEWYRKIGKKDVYYPECVLPNKKAFILLDYITNLQQENERLKGAIEVIKNTNKLLIQQKARIQDDLDMLDKRIDKAIELLELKQLRYLNEDDYRICTLDLQEVKDILQNGSEDND